MVVNADNNDLIWNAGFHFINLTPKQAEDLRISTLDKWGDNKVLFIILMAFQLSHNVYD